MLLDKTINKQSKRKKRKDKTRKQQARKRRQRKQGTEKENEKHTQDEKRKERNGNKRTRNKKENDKHKDDKQKTRKGNNISEPPRLSRKTRFKRVFLPRCKTYHQDKKKKAERTKTRQNVVLSLLLAYYIRQT